MKKTVTIPAVVKTTAEVEVEFPIYHKHDLLLDEADIVAYRRIDADLSAVEITRTRGREGLSFEIKKDTWRFDGAESDYLLGRGKYACTRFEFDAVLDEALTFLGSFRAPL